jgi:heme-degrading monooxygenase HmoA
MKSKIWSLILAIGVCVLLLFPLLIRNTQGSSSGIARVWEGRTTAENADAYEAYLNDVAVNQLASTEGHLGIQILRRATSTAVEFVVISYWESTDAITAFVGGNIDNVVPLPRDNEFLIEPVNSVRHYEVALSRYN